MECKKDVIRRNNYYNILRGYSNCYHNKSISKITTVNPRSGLKTNDFVHVVVFLLATIQDLHDRSLCAHSTCKYAAAYVWRTQEPIAVGEGIIEK